MAFDFSEFKEELRLLFYKYSLGTWVLIALFVSCLLFVLFLGIVGIFISVVLIFAVVFFLILQKGRDSLQQQKALLLRENQEAERRFLKHLIDEKTYKALISANEKRIIEIDAKINAKSNEVLSEVLESSGLSIRKKHKLKELLDEKQKISSELNFAKAKYYKHKLDEKSFQDLSMEKQAKLVELDTQISDLYRQEAQDIMKDTARKLRGIRDSESIGKELDDQVPQKRQKHQRL